jgi:hypothetical protein
MFRYCLVLLAGIWVASPAGAGTWADSLFDELTKDFGSVPRGPTLSHSFRVTNRTGKTVHIGNIRVSCGCTSAEALKETLRPGESTNVVARMDTTRFTGAKNVTIFVQFDQPKFEEVRLWVQANGRDDFRLSPDTLSFGQVKRHTTPAARLDITFYGYRNARIVSARGESNYIRPVFQEVRRGDSEVVYRLTARLRGDTPVGKWYTDVWVKTNIPNMPQLRVPLTVEVASSLSVTPEAVRLGRLKVDGESERRVIVRGVKPFKIQTIGGTDTNLWVRDNTSQSRAIHVLTIKYKADTAGEFSRLIRVRTDLGGDDGEIDFRVTATVTR